MKRLHFQITPVHPIERIASVAVLGLWQWAVAVAVDCAKGKRICLGCNALDRTAVVLS